MKTASDFDEVLKAEGLEHFIGHVSFKVVGNELRVYPETDYTREYIGENDYLGFKI